MFIHPASLQREDNTSHDTPPSQYPPPLPAAALPPPGLQPFLCRRGKPTGVGYSQGRVLGYSGLSAGLAVLLVTWAAGAQQQQGGAGGSVRECRPPCRWEWGQGRWTRACE